MHTIDYGMDPNVRYVKSKKLCIQEWIKCGVCYLIFLKGKEEIVLKYKVSQQNLCR